MEVSEKLIEAFKVMWGGFPEPVTLVHKSKEIIAVNDACAAIGRDPGIKCSQIGPAEAHAGCLANSALKEGKAKYSRSLYGDREIISYWLPLSDYPDYFVHFGVGVTIDYSLE